jgi:hypothetical protein
VLCQGYHILMLESVLVEVALHAFCTLAVAVYAINFAAINL